LVKFIYLLCALTALGCAGLLLRAYATNKYRILLWSGLCFAGMFINNALLVLDRFVFPDIDLSTWRLGAAVLSLCLLIYGLLWEEE
jgi:hypothetical protein